MSGIYASRQDLETILTTLWERIFATPKIAEPLSQLSLVVKFRFTDFNTELYIVIEPGNPRVLWNPDTGIRADVEMILASETGHRFWMEDLNVPLALAGRKIVAKGSVQKALKLLPALKPAFALYPQVLHDLGRSELLEKKQVASKRSRLFRFPGFKRKKGYDASCLPDFPLDFKEPIRTVETKDHKDAADDMELYRVMVRIRAFEQHLSDSFRKGDIPSEAIHLSIGQEAVAAGVCLNLKNSDYINTTHRGHGHIIAKGTDLNRMMAELYGKKTGLCEGKGGSMHVTDGSLGILGANGIVGAGYLLALGAAKTIEHEKRDDVSVVFAGDGSVNQGMFHEALNMAGVMGLPLLVIVENNLYGEFTPLDKHSAETAIYKRMQAYNIESVQLDGNDARQVAGRMKEIIAAMRKDGKPRGVEMKTYRWHGHMEGEPELYRTVEEKKHYRDKDPIARLEKELIEDGRTTARDLEALRKDVEREIAEAVAFAMASPEPEPEELSSRIYFPDGREMFEGGFEEKPEGPSLSFSQAINQALAEEMQRDSRVFLWGEDVALGGYFSVTEGLVDTLGRSRIIDTPISENAIVGGAVGAAMTGLRPVCEILFADFLTCCMDPLMNQAAKLRYMTGGQVAVPLTVRTPVGSGIGMAAQHSQSMERYFSGMPGLLVVAPSDPYTAKGLLKTAIRSNNPVLFFEHKLLYANAGPVPEGDYTLPLGKARCVRKGSDVTVVTHLLGVSMALDAAALLEARGISVEVIDLVSLYPLDTETILKSVEKTGALVTLEEGTITLGIGAEVLARVCTAGHHLLRRPPLRIAAPDYPVPYAKNLENALMHDPSLIAEKIVALV